MVAIGEGWRRGVDGRAQFRGAEQSARDEMRRSRFLLPQWRGKVRHRLRASHEGILSRSHRDGRRLVDLAPGKSLAKPFTLAAIKADKILKEMVLAKLSRLSVSPLTEA